MSFGLGNIFAHTRSSVEDDLKDTEHTAYSWNSPSTGFFEPGTGYHNKFIIYPIYNLIRIRYSIIVTLQG